jgi:hypothetical protein
LFTSLIIIYGIIGFNVKHFWLFYSQIARPSEQFRNLLAARLSLFQGNRQEPRARAETGALRPSCAKRARPNHVCQSRFASIVQSAE